jgi:putative sterol carrier protein
METLEGLISGKENAVNLFMSGRLQIEGDMALAMNLQTLF